MKNTESLHNTKVNSQSDQEHVEVAGCDGDGLPEITGITTKEQKRRNIDMTR